MALNPQMSARAQQQLGLPEGFKAYSPFPFAGVNTNASPIAIDDSEFVYVENFVRLGDGRLRALYDAGAATYSAPTGQSVVYYSFFTLASNYYCAIFLSDGSAVQLDMNTLAQTSIGPAGTFYKTSTGKVPYAKQWGTTYLLISNSNTVNDYWAWDGLNLYGPGTAAIDGVNLLSPGAEYSDIPTVTPIGGSGTGLVIQPQIQNGVVVGLKITNPGQNYKPGDLIQLQFSGGGSEKNPILKANLVGIKADGPSAGAPGVGGVVILSGGSGYTSPPSVAFIGGGGSGAAGTAQIADGSVYNVIITAKGSGYTDLPAVQFTGGGGSGASGQAILQPSVVGTITIVDGGTGFTGTAAMPNPTLTIVGGGGSGATATCTISGGAINTVTVTNSGINYTSPPTVLVNPGSNPSAYATVTVMPWGVSASAMETYLNRVWTVTPAQARYATLPAGVQYSGSAPGSVSNFAGSAGGVAANSGDSFLQTKFVNVHQSAGYLYLFGDGSINVISGVSTSGSPVVTTYNNFNVDPQAGLSWRDALQDFGRSIIIANELGVFECSGGAAQKISEKLDGFFSRYAVWPSAGGVTPSAAIFTFKNVKFYALLFSAADPDTGVVRKILAVFDGKEWTFASQSVDLVYITTRKVGSQYEAWGSDGRSLFRLFSTPSAALPKRIDTKQYGVDTAIVQKQALALWLEAEDNSASRSGVSGSFQAFISGIAPISGAYEQPTLVSGLFDVAAVQPSFQTPEPSYGLWGTSLGGAGFVTMSARFTFSSPDFTLGNIVIGYANVTAYYGA